MARMTNYSEDEFLNAYFRNGSSTKPVSLECAFWDGDPGEDGTGATEVEPFGAGVRLALTFNNSTARTVSNTNAPTNTATGSGTATWWSVHRTDLANQMLCYEQLDSSMVFTVGQPIEIAIGDMTWNFPQETSPEECHSDTLVNDWLSYWLGAQATPTQTASVFMSLHAGDPGETGSAEFTGGSYTRQQVQWNAPSSGANNRQQITNQADINFTDLPALNLQWWGIWTLASGGTFLTRSDQTDQLLTAGDNASAAAGAIAILAG